MIFPKWQSAVYLPLLCLVLGWLSPGSALAEQKKLSAVADLRYGVSLYHYYQNENLQALSELMVAQHQGGIQGHGDNPEIMEGGFSMAYGMEQKAADIFERLLDANRPKQTRDAAWFYLAKMRYLRGDWPAAHHALEQISDEPVASLVGELMLLRFNLAVQQNQLELAQSLAQKIPRDNASWPYMQFNLGTAFSRERLYVRGVEFFTKLLKMEHQQPEYLALYDKAMTAAGYGFLLQKKYPEAIGYFTQVRLNSPLSNRALLGYGWAALEQEDYETALKPWQALAKRPLIDENTQEALIAIPYAYEKMGYQSLALREFQQAEQNYLKEISKLDSVIANVQGYAIREALDIQRSQDFDWLNYAEKSQLSPQLSYLIPLFSRESFIGGVQELRDLLAIQAQYGVWQEKLTFYQAMLDERESNRATEMDYITQQAVAEKILALEAARNELAETLSEIGLNQEFSALVSPKEAPSMERILRAEKNIALLTHANSELGVEVMPEDELQQLAETLRRQKGIMLWNTAGMFDERYWRVKHSLAEVNETLAGIRKTEARINRIVSQGFDLTPYRARIARAEEQLLLQTVDVELAIEAAQDAMRDKVLLVLQAQRERLFHYLAQSRLSIARLLDQTRLEADESASPAVDAQAPPSDPQETPRVGNETAQEAQG